MKERLLSLLLLCNAMHTAMAQPWVQIHHRARSHQWVMPVQMQHMGEIRAEGTTLQMDVKDSLGNTRAVVSKEMDNVDSITIVQPITDEEKGHDPYRVFAMYINTQDGVPVADRDTWVPCFISMDGMGQYSHYAGTGRIRGRGNSTWEWYNKKPYKIKLDEKSKLLGLDRARNWNLMANYRDMTDLMNAFAFEVARCMGMPHTNHTRFVEVFLNGAYIGLYQLTEKIEVAGNRIDIDRDEGVLLSFDADDGPSLSPDAGDNFWSRTYRLPVCVKYPEDVTDARKTQIRDELKELEDAIKQHDYARACQLMDMDSYIHILQMHELLYNVEIDAPRSLYMYRDKDGRYTFGPVWDWDAGYDFDWSTMYTGHNYFANYRELIYGTDPVNHTGAAYQVSGFWTDLFRSSQFVTRYQELWNQVSDTLLAHAWSEMERYLVHLRDDGAYHRESLRWNVHGMDSDTEVNRMYLWLQRRIDYINKVVRGYPRR